MTKSEIKIYKTVEGKTSIEVKIDKETVWLNQYQLEELFETNRSTINKHILNIYKSEELNEESTCAKIAQVQKEGKRTVKRNIKYYNLDVIISVGYRVNSKRGTEFRIWATQLLKEYLLKGYAINQQSLEKQVEQFNELKKTVKILGNALEYKELTNDESKGLLLIPALFYSLFPQSFLQKMSWKAKNSLSISVPDRNRESECAKNNPGFYSPGIMRK